MPLTPDDVRTDIFGIDLSRDSGPRVEELTDRQYDRRQRILGAAVEVAAVGGYSAVHMRDIAERAGVSMATLYHYFPSKVHLLVTALENELAQFDDHLQHDLIGVDGPFVRLRVAVTALIDAMERSERITEALTHAYAASYVVAGVQAQTVHDQTSRLFADLMRADRPAQNYQPFADILADVWTSEILGLVQERRTFGCLRTQLLTAIDLLDRTTAP